VLLKNEFTLLPLSERSKVVLIGAFAERPRFQGAGSSQVHPTQVDTLRQALTDYLGEIEYAQGYDPAASRPNQTLIVEAAALAKRADIAVVYAGLPGIYESEGFDREHLDLPDQHTALITAVCAANPNTVVVLANGAPVTMPWLDQVPAVLEGYLGGQASGSGIADVLMGVQNPAGKLAETFPLSLEDVPCTPFFPGENRQMQYREGIYVGYRYYDTARRDVLFPFGHGLSYTEFEYVEANTDNASLTADGSITLNVTLKNTGNRAGAEVIQVYRHTRNSATHQPDQQLCGFAKVLLQSAQAATVTITLASENFRTFDHGTNNWVLEAGTIQLRIGSSSRDIRLTQAINVVSTQTFSDVAKATDTPEFSPQGRSQALSVSDALFGRMLNRPTPTGEEIRPFHRNSSLAEIGTTWLGSKVHKRALAGFLGGMGLQDADATTRKMFEEMANHMPLRAAVLFQQGQISFDQVDALLELLNGHPLTALQLLLKDRRARSAHNTS
jgi:beta-glucosidase